MPQKSVVVVLAALFSAATLAAQPAPAKPGTEHQKMNYYVGTWTLESDLKASPFGPAGKMTGTETVEKGPGGFFVVFRSDAKTPAGPMQRLGVMGFDAQAKAFTFRGFDSMGITGFGTGTVKGKVWSWTTEDNVSGKTVRGRFTLNETSPTSYTFKYEMVGDDGKWSTVEEGKATKRK